MGARLLSVILLACGCVPGPVDNLPEPPPPPEPAPVGVDDCESAHARLIKLGCAETTTPKGASFQEACEAAAADGRNWRPDCIAQIRSCDEIETMYSTPEGTACPTLQ